ncbi:MAG TPA: DUF1360 domain-containing protein [Pseudonocardiaceae bacterium]|jgi:hypothetical protein|nr:DUF1360 domain-containing protein [Pseudonocardiaceae bacterium]
MQDVRQQVIGTAQEETEAYRQGADRPLGGYVVVMAVFAALVAGAAGLAAATGRRLPPEIGPWDVFLLTLGTHKLSRTMAKDAVTSPLRAPFTRYSGTGGPAEVMEDVRDTSSLRHSIGELITCPFCLDVWIATSFAIGFVFAPRVTRLVAATFTALTGADFLHLGYARAQQAAE